MPDEQRAPETEKVVKVHRVANGYEVTDGLTEELWDQGGVMPNFLPEELNIMKARAAAFGYTLEVH